MVLSVHSGDMVALHVGFTLGLTNDVTFIALPIRSMSHGMLVSVPSALLCSLASFHCDSLGWYSW